MLSTNGKHQRGTFHFETQSVNFTVISASNAISSPLENLRPLKRFQCWNTFYSFLLLCTTIIRGCLPNTRDVYELENNFSTIYPRRLGSFKSFYDTAVSYPSPFTVSRTVGRKLIKANGECELQLQEARVSRSKVDRRSENPPSGCRNHDRGHLRELIDAETQFDQNAERVWYSYNWKSLRDSIESGIFEDIAVLNGASDVSRR